jgi:hypothetical protein
MIGVSSIMDPLLEEQRSVIKLWLQKVKSPATSFRGLNQTMVANVKSFVNKNRRLTLEEVANKF